MSNENSSKHACLPLGVSQIHAYVKHSKMWEVGQIQETGSDDIKTRHVKRSVSRMSTSIENDIKQTYRQLMQSLVVVFKIMVKVMVMTFRAKRSEPSHDHGVKAMSRSIEAAFGVDPVRPGRSGQEQHTL